MTYCIDFFRKFKKEGNFCGLDKTQVSRLNAYLDVVEMLMKQKIAEETVYTNFPVGAARPLLSAKGDERTEALNFVTSALKSGKKITQGSLQSNLKQWKLSPPAGNVDKKLAKSNFPSEEKPKTEPVVKKQDPAKCFSPQPGTIPHTDAPPQPSLAEQIRAKEGPMGPAKPLPCSWITAPSKNIEEVRKAEREELEARAEALLELMPKSTQLAVTELLREHPSWKVKDAFYYGIECLWNRLGRK